jgi:hypothetical protein
MAVLNTATVLLCLAGCGGKGTSFTLGHSFDQDHQINSRFVQAVQNGLQTKYHFTYSTAGYPTADSCSVVPLRDEFTPDEANKAQYQLAVEGSATAKVAKLSTTGSSQILLHFRYDPNQWEVAGVGSLNPWPGSKEFLPVATAVEPGVLLLANRPVNAGSSARGQFAQVNLVPRGSKAGRNIPAPAGKDSTGMLWHATGDPNNTFIEFHGSLNYRLDGKLGDINENFVSSQLVSGSRDGDLTGDELTDSSNDDLVHSAVVDDLGCTYATDDAWPAGFHARWSEQLNGDYDNNGWVTINDITPVGINWADGATRPYWAQRAMRGIAASGDSDFLDLKKAMTATSTTWPLSGQIVNAFWFYDATPAVQTDNPSASTAGDLYNYDVAKTPISNGLDGNWDGYVFDYNNWDSQDPANPGTTSKYDDLANGWYHPGDLTPIGRHLGDQLGGYRVFTCQRDSANYDPDADLVTTYAAPPTEGSGVTNIRNYKRTAGTATPSAWDGSSYPAPIVYDIPGSQFIKGQVDFNLQAADFATTSGTTDADYDILVYPYVYVGGQTHYGVPSRFEQVFHYRYDNLGPKYVAAQLGSTAGASAVGLRLKPGGLTNQGDINIISPAPDFNQFQLTYYNADDVVPSVHRITGAAELAWGRSAAKQHVTYELYASNSQGDVFDHLIRTWIEGAGTTTEPDVPVGDDNELRAKTIDLSTDDEGLTLTNGATLWFGLRALENDGSPIYEYSVSGSTPAPNTKTRYVELGAASRIFGPEYGNDGTLQPGTDTSDKGILTDSNGAQQLGSQSAFKLRYWNADDVDNSAGTPVWGATAVIYALYASTTDSTGAALFGDSGNRLFTWAEGQASGGQLTTAEHAVTSNSLQREVSLDLAAFTAQLDLNTPGHALYFGIRAFKPDGSTLEYTNTTIAANTAVKSLTLNDTLAPYFLADEPGSPPTYSASTPATDDAVRYSIPYDHSIAVYYNRAIDPPVYDPEAELTYHCFWAPGNVTIDPEDPGANATEVLPAQTISYADTLDSTGQWNRENYCFVIDDSGAGLTPGDSYNFYIYAEDANSPPNRTQNTTTASQTTTDFSNVGVDLASSLKQAAGGVVGDMSGDAGVVTLLYPYATVDDTGGLDRDYAELRYEELTNGSLSTRVTENDILHSAAAMPPAQPQPAAQGLDASNQTTLDFVRELNGEPSTLGGFRRATIGYEGTVGYTGGFPQIKSLMSNRRQGPGSWSTPVLHTQAEESGGLTCLSSGCLSSNFNYKAASWQNLNLLSWAVEWTPDDNDPFPGDVRFKTATSPSGFNPSSYSVMETAHGYKTSYQTGWNTDLISRQAGVTISGGVPNLVGTSTGNRLYLLADSAPENPQQVTHQHQTLMLFDTADGSSWSGTDLMYGSPLPNLNLSAPSMVGPVSLEVTRSQSGATNHVYVAYCNAAADEGTNLANGLRIACSDQPLGGSSTWSWATSSTVGIISNTFRYHPQGSEPSNDIVDLRVKTGAKASDYQFDRLGCAYINGDGSLELAETNGTGTTATWGKITIGTDPNYPNAIDRGLFRWVKLAYFDADASGPGLPKAYVMYSIKTSQTPAPGLYAIRLWIQP